MSTARKIEGLIREKLAPTHLDVVDESLAHLGHAGAQTGGGHFSVLVVSPSFAGKSTVERHRLVYQALGDMMRQEIHALAMKVQTPEEWEKAK